MTLEELHISKKEQFADVFFTCADIECIANAENIELTERMIDSIVEKFPVLWQDAANDIGMTILKILIQNESMLDQINDFRKGK